MNSRTLQFYGGHAARQWHLWTRDWWTLRRPVFECVISGEVLQEAAEGANAMILSRLRPVGEAEGFHLPEVCTPLQLMGTIEYED